MLKLNNNIIINLDNVNSIIALENRIVFNFNYPVTVVRDGEQMQRSDYVYYDNYKKFTTLENLDNIFIDNNFIKCENKWINPKNIAFVKYDNNRNRIIVNFNSSISFKKNNETHLTSDFIYIDSKDENEFNERRNKLECFLGAY